MSEIFTPQEKLDIYKNLFKGRDEVFAVRWEKADKSTSGYTPVCANEWNKGLCNKILKKKCKDCLHKKYLPIDDYHLGQHLRGNKTYGIYPLLKDNTSYFLAVDFDGTHWQDEAIRFIHRCDHHTMPAYLERSRSGNGGHVWIFFEKSYSAHKSRAIAVSILRELKIIDQFEKEESFDRLFPNQDMLSGEGFGNLIALPLQGESRRAGNTVFLNLTNNLMPFPDQWYFLAQIKKLSPQSLDDLYNKFHQQEKNSRNVGKGLRITIGNQLYLNKTSLPRSVINFLRESLNFCNSEYLIKKNMGVNTYGMERYFKLIETSDDAIIIPRGFLEKLTSFLNEQAIPFELRDERTKAEHIEIESSLKLFEYQQEAVDKILTVENGILVAPPGSGKTMMGIEIITRLQQPTLILVHKKQIFNQWIERIEHFLNIPKREIGQYYANKKKVGDKITVAMVQTLNKMEDFKDLSSKFGLLIVDECHHMPAKMFRSVITKFNPYYLYGLTATPERKNNDEKLIFIYLGEILHTIHKDFLSSPKTSVPEVKQETKIILKETSLEIPFKVKTDNFQVLSRIIIFDSQRNNQIVSDIQKEVKRGSKCLVLTERKEHVEVLSYYLKRDYEIITMTGELSETQRKEKIKQIESGHFQILIATGQLLGEGTDFPGLDSLFLVYPFAFSGKLTQYIGRIQRGLPKSSVIYDYRDSKVEYLEKFFKKRMRYYKKNFVIKS